MRVKRRKAGRRTGVGLAIVAAVVVADVVLIGAALQRDRQPPASSGPSSTEVTGQATAAPTAPPVTESPSTVATTLAEIRDLTMSTASVGWRVVRGSCPAGGATVEGTTDGGATWSAVPLPRPTSEVLQLIASSSETARLALVTRDGGCGLQFDRTFSAGGAWQVDPDTRLSPTFVDAGSLIVAGEPSSAPCAEPLHVVVIDDTVAVQCLDGVYMGIDGGDWSSDGRGGVLGLGSAGDAFLVARTAADCEGVLVERLALDGQTSAGQCVALDGEGSVAVAASGATLLTWQGGEVLRSPLEV